MTFQELLEIALVVIEALIENCPEPEPEQRVRRLRSPQPIDWARLNIGLRREGLNRQERRQAVQIVTDLSTEATDEDLRALVDAAGSRKA